MYEYPFRVPAYFALIIRSLVTLEGIAINVDPNFKVLGEAYPYIAKRLLTDPAPELRNSLKELLFKEESFRWNRLEGLLKNAKGSMEYDISGSLDQGIEFLFSEQGNYIRERLIEEIIKNVDLLGQNAWKDFTSNIGSRLGLSTEPLIQSPQSLDNAATLEYIKRIWAILQDTEGFDANHLLTLLPKLAARAETQQMGQRIAMGLTQRLISRFIREVLLADQSNRSVPKNRTNPVFIPPNPPLRPIGSAR